MKTQSYIKLILFTSICLFTQQGLTSEKSELDRAIKQLESAKQSLIRAKKARAYSYNERFFFDYSKLYKDIRDMQLGINEFINLDRAQPRIARAAPRYNPQRINKQISDALSTNNSKVNLGSADKAKPAAQEIKAVEPKAINKEDNSLNSKKNQ